MTAPVRAVDLLRVSPGRARRRADRVVTEEPLEIRITGEPFATTMRTPGRDRDLAAGFLLSERVVRNADDIAAIRHCTHPDDSGAPARNAQATETRRHGEDRRSAGAEPSSGGAPGEAARLRASADEEAHNVVDVWLAGDAVERGAAHLAGRRRVDATSACGVCGRRSIDELTRGCAPLPVSWRVTRDAVLAWPARLREAQPAFDETGGVHAAALVDADGAILAMAEDIGRHNAVDKVVGGELLAERLPLGDRGLLVSGRASFEIVQKALVAGIPLVAAVSAPSSLAVDLARESGITLLGFVRGASFNVYTHPERVLV